MIFLDIVVDLIIMIYTSLGFGTNEHKIQTKMEKLGKQYPTALQIYFENQTHFEKDSELSNAVLSLDIKDSEATTCFIHEIQNRFKAAPL
ncbi:MAG: hypothetical protein ACI33P_11150 [Lysinibacillus sp.]